MQQNSLRLCNTQPRRFALDYVYRIKSYDEDNQAAKGELGFVHGALQLDGIKGQVTRERKEKSTGLLCHIHNSQLL